MPDGRKFPFIQSTEPTTEIGLGVGDIWVDTSSTPVLKKCTSVDPVTFTSCEGAGGGSTLTVSESEVYSAAAPTTWTDLDLSGTVGSNSALVRLKVQSAYTAAVYAFRRNGDTDEHYANIAAANAMKAYSTSVYGTIIIETDSSGVVEWKAGNNASTTVDVVSYIK